GMPSRRPWRLSSESCAVPPMRHSFRLSAYTQLAGRKFHTSSRVDGSLQPAGIPFQEAMTPSPNRLTRQRKYWAIRRQVAEKRPKLIGEPGGNHLAERDYPSSCIGAARMRPGGRGYDVDRAIRC